MFYQFVEVAAGKVGTADAALEQYVAGEHAVLCRAVVHQAARRVSRHVDGFQLRMAEGDDVAVVQVSAQRYGRFRQLETEHAALFGCFVNPELIRLVGFRFQSEFFQHEGVAEDVVQVQVRVQQVLHLQPVADDKVL